MLFSDEKLQKMHEDNNYKKTNSFFKNVKYSFGIIKNGHGDISLSINGEFHGSININLVKLLWFLLRYVFITKELVNFRKFFLESYFHIYLYDKINIRNLLADKNNRWLTYDKSKLSIVCGCCTSYLHIVENRLLLAKYSLKKPDESEKILTNEISSIESLFNEEIEKCQSEQLTALSYELLLMDPDYVKLFRQNLDRSLSQGNLTPGKKER